MAVDISIKEREKYFFDIIKTLHEEKNVPLLKDLTDEERNDMWALELRNIAGQLFQVAKDFLDICALYRLFFLDVLKETPLTWNVHAKDPYDDEDIGLLSQLTLYGILPVLAQRGYRSKDPTAPLCRSYIQFLLPRDSVLFDILYKLLANHEDLLFALSSSTGTGCTLNIPRRWPRYHSSRWRILPPPGGDPSRKPGSDIVVVLDNGYQEILPIRMMPGWRIEDAFDIHRNPPERKWNRLCRFCHQVRLDRNPNSNPERGMETFYVLHRSYGPSVLPILLDLVSAALYDDSSAKRAVMKEGRIEMY